MTQFALGLPRKREPNTLQFRPVGSDQAVLQEASGELFPAHDDVVVPYMKTGEDVGELFDEAHNAVYNGRAFVTTELSSFLAELLQTCESIALWWGNDWQDLPTAHTREQFVDEVVRQLREPTGEVYLRWKES